MYFRLLPFLFLHVVAPHNIYHRIIDDICGQVTLQKNVKQFAVKYGHLRAGPCDQDYYPVYLRDDIISAGPFGDISVQLFSKQDISNTWNN